MLAIQQLHSFRGLLYSFPAEETRDTLCRLQRMTALAYARTRNLRNADEVQDAIRFQKIAAEFSAADRFYRDGVES